MMHDEFDADSDERIAVVAGDWHSDLVHLTSNVPKVLDRGFPSGGPQPTTLLHVGDFNVTNGSRVNKRFLARAAELAEHRQLRILLTPGNHDSWSRLQSRTDFREGLPTRLHGAVWALPRGYRFRMGGRCVLSFGGAGSVRRDTKREGVSWWRTEMPSDAEVNAAVAAGAADILITHEGPNGGTRRVDRRVSLKSPIAFEAAEYTALGRDRVTRLWAGVRPQLLFHGHHHVQAEGHHPDGRSVYSLGQNREAGNLLSLDLTDLRVEWLQGGVG